MRTVQCKRANRKPWSCGPTFSNSRSQACRCYSASVNSGCCSKPSTRLTGINADSMLWTSDCREGHCGQVDEAPFLQAPGSGELRRYKAGALWSVQVSAEASPPTHRSKMTKFAAIIAAAVLVVGFAPTGNAVCNNGEIGLGVTNGVNYTCTTPSLCSR